MKEMKKEMNVISYVKQDGDFHHLSVAKKLILHSEFLSNRLVCLSQLFRIFSLKLKMYLYAKLIFTQLPREKINNS